MCTGLQINYPGGSVLGRTMDIEMSLDYQLNFIPRNFQFAKDLFNQPLVSRYRMMGLGFNAVSYTHLTLPTICSV